MKFLVRVACRNGSNVEMMIHNVKEISYALVQIIFTNAQMLEPEFPAQQLRQIQSRSTTDVMMQAIVLKGLNAQDWTIIGVSAFKIQTRHVGKSGPQNALPTPIVALGRIWCV